MMNAELAESVFVVIMIIGFLTWLWSLQMALGIGRQANRPDWRVLDEQNRTNAESGARTVRGTPEKLSAGLARALVLHNVGTFGSLFEIVERTPERVALQKTGPLLCSQPPSLYFSEAEFTFDRLGNDSTRVTYELGFDRLTRRVKQVALAIIFGIGLPVMLVVGGMIWYFVLPSQNPAVQWQVFQALQIGHALWPPFLFLWLYRAGRRQSKTYFSNLLSTLELAE